MWKIVSSAFKVKASKNTSKYIPTYQSIKKAMMI